MPRHKTKSRASQRLSPLGRYLAAVVTERGINRSRLAELSGINRSTLAGVMGTKHAPSIESLKAIASGLSKILPNPVTVDDLLEIQGGKRSPSPTPPAPIAPEVKKSVDEKEILLRAIRDNLISLVHKIDRSSTPIENIKVQPMTCQFNRFIAQSLADAGIRSDPQLEAQIKDIMLAVQPVDQLRLQMICKHQLEPTIQDLPRLAIFLSGLTGQRVTQQDLVDLINADCGHIHAHTQG